MNAVVLESTLHCPACGHAKTEVMPTEACQWFYECEACHTVLKPKHGDCPDGHPKLPHLWPVKLLQAGRSNYEASGLMAMRAAASLRR